MCKIHRTKETSKISLNDSIFWYGFKKIKIILKPKLLIHLFLKVSLDFSKDSPHKIELDSINRDERNITHSVSY